MIFLNLFTIFILVTIIVYLIGYLLKRQKLYKQAKALPGHKLSIFKAFRLFLFSTPKNVIKNVEKVLENDSKLIKTWFLGYFVILTKDADFINKILNSPQTYDKVGDLNKKAFLRNGLINLNGDEHKRHRKTSTKHSQQKCCSSFRKFSMLNLK